jgi:hypothetical protein
MPRERESYPRSDGRFRGRKPSGDRARFDAATSLTGLRGCGGNASVLEECRLVR